MKILDTNVVSELMRPQPDVAVVDWVARQSPRDVATTSVTVAEVRYGIARLRPGRRRASLLDAADRVFEMFAEAIASFDAPAARRYAEIVVARERAGTPISGFDAQIAAICGVHDATLVTRNVKDFVGVGIDVEDPWSR